MSLKDFALVTALVFGAASAAIAAPSASLTTGGRTIAGPGKGTIAANLTLTFYTHAGPNTDVCATVINGSRSSIVRITLVGQAASTVTLDVAAGGTGALCHDGVSRMDLTCVADTASCTAQWRVDDN